MGKTGMRIEYIMYQYKEHIIPYNIRADTFDTPYYNDMDYKVIESIRFLAESDIKVLKADDMEIVELRRETVTYKV